MKGYAARIEAAFVATALGAFDPMNAGGGHPYVADAQTCAVCHLPTTGQALSTAWDSGESATFLEPAAGSTKLCVSCHAEKTPSATPGGRDHPVGVDYLEAFYRLPGKFAHPASAGIVLDGGAVGCVSCHALHERGGIRSTPGAGLCRSCHTL
jgi:hypothetical protein